MNEYIVYNALILTVFLMLYIHKSADPKLIFLHKTLVLYFWFFALFPVCLLPLEMIRKNINTEEERSFILQITWRVYFLINFLNGVIFLPIVIRFCLSGEFSFKTQFYESLQSKLFTIIAVAITGLSIALFFLYLCSFDLIFWVLATPKILDSIFYLLFSFLLSYGMLKLPTYFLGDSIKRKVNICIEEYCEIKKKFFPLLAKSVQYYSVF